MTRPHIPFQSSELMLAAELEQQQLRAQTRRHFLSTCAIGLGGLFLSTTAGRAVGLTKNASDPAVGGERRLDFSRDSTTPLAQLSPVFTARARRVIYLHMAGAPSQLELFEHKPVLTKYDAKDCPASMLAGKRFAFITGVPKLMGSQYPFHQAGASGAWFSDRMPHLERYADELCFIRSLRTD